MLIARNTTLSLAICLTLIGDSSAQSRKQPSQPNKISEPEKATQPDQRGGPDNPLTVNVVPTPEQKNATEKQQASAELKAADDHKLVDYTHDLVLIGIVQFLIFILQLIAFSLQACYMRRTLTEMRRTTHATIRAARATQKAAIAAHKSSEAIPNAERAYIFLRSIEFDGKNLPAGIGDEKRINISVTFDNVGKTPAIPKTFQLGIIADHIIPTTKVLDELSPLILQTRVVGARAPFVQTKINIRGDWRQRPVSMPIAERVFLVGLLKYMDVFDGRGETCFCWELDWQLEEFREVLDAPSLNYERYGQY